MEISDEGERHMWLLRSGDEGLGSVETINL